MAEMHRVHVQQLSESRGGPRRVWLDGREVHVRRIAWQVEVWDPAVVTLEVMVGPDGLTISPDRPEGASDG
ncbi:hypothetical protein BH23CHL8_BH23CHL8_30520 [soil metagenome]